MDVSGAVSLTDIIGTRSVTDVVEDAVRQHARFVYRLAFAVLRNEQEAEDVAQDTFVRMWRQAEKLPNVRDQRAWLARIAWRVIAKRRKKRREETLDYWGHSIDVPAPDISTEQVLIEREERRVFDRMVASLPPELYEIVALSTVEEMTAAQIAAMLEIPDSTVRGRLLRARQMLREKLQRVTEGTK